jgi:hypothetical protein
MAFLSPLFLLGAIAAAVPLLVHLVRRTRATRVPFASLMFLRRIEQKTIRKRHIRNILLLLMRCAALLLLALAFARPYFTQQNSLAAGEQQASSVILIDSSFSMRYPGVFDRAKDAAREAIANTNAQERIAVISFGQSYEILMPLKASRAEATAIVDQMQAGLTATDYLQAIQAADAMLKEAGGSVRRVYLISDFHSAGWNRTAAPVKLSPGVELITRDISASERNNIAVSQVRAESLVYALKYPGKITTTLNNFSADSGSETTVDFKLNDLVVERRAVDIDPADSASIDFSGFNVTEGPNRATIEITGDNFPVDNKYFFTINRRNQTRALAIETASRGRSETFFVSHALNAGESGQYALAVKSSGSANPAEIDTYERIILNDPDRISDALADSIRSYVERGGGLILVAGRHIDHADVNKLFGSILPAELGEAVQTRSFAMLSQIKTDHPIFNVFAQGGRLASTRVYGFRRAVPKDGAQTIAALDDGSPVIIEGTAGRGKVLLITTTFDTAWNDLPITPMFLPLVRQMLEYMGGRANAPVYTVGQALIIPPDRDGSLPAIDSPAGGRLETRASSTGEVAIQANEIGFYRLRYRDRDEYVAVNVDAKESDLTKLDIDEFRANILPEGSEQSSSPFTPGLTPEEIEGRQRLWLPLLIAALALFIGEALIARRIRLAKVIG